LNDPYRVLQVDPSAEPEVIEAAYRRLVRKYHPDVNSAPTAGARMKELIDAYTLVRDPARRAELDRRRAPWWRALRDWRWLVRWWRAPGSPGSPEPVRAPGPLTGSTAGPEGPECSRHRGRLAIGECRVCGGSLCATCASLVQPAGCAPCVWRRARRVQVRALAAIAGFVAAFAFVLAMAMGTLRTPVAVALVVAYLISATALGISVTAGRMWRSGWQDEPADMDLGVTFLVWIGLLIGWVGAPVLLVKMVRDVSRGGRLAARAGEALMEA
jgi:hypothetical protein